MPAAQLASFTARFGPKPAALVKTLRTQLRRRLPHAHELVYNYNHACVISYGPTDRPYHAPLSLSVQASGVSLYFLNGPTLPDPKNLLQGTGKQVRFVPLPTAASFSSPDVASLIAAALQAAPVPFDPALRPGLIIKSNSAKPGRPRAAVPPSAKSKVAIRNSKVSPQSASPASQLAGFLAKFTPAMAARIKAARAKMRKIVPHAHELVYDNYNFFVIGYGPTERPSAAVFSLACQASGVSLCFLWGAKLPDPKKLLRGSGSQVRSIKLPNTSTLDEPAVQALISAAIKSAPVAFDPSVRPQLIIKSISAKQRPRRAAAVSAQSKIEIRNSKI